MTGVGSLWLLDGTLCPSLDGLICFMSLSTVRFI
jgi:hypothetical protein